MTALKHEPPRLLLGTESLLGVSSATRDRTLQVAARFAEPESLAVTFSKAMALGADGVLASPTRTLRQALDELKGAIPVYALLPNVPEYVRDSSVLGLFGAARKRFSQARLGAQLRLGLTGMTHAAGVLTSDFAALVPLLLELEAAWLGARDLRGIVLAAPLTDLALAGRHRKFFERTIRYVHGRFHATAAFETRNLGHLLAALEEWKIAPDFVIGPVNPRGLLMKPSPSELLEALRRTNLTVLAQELRAGGPVSLVEGARFALAAGARGLVADLVDLDEASELKELNEALPARAG
jgi:hypothetical protein